MAKNKKNSKKLQDILEAEKKLLEIKRQLQDAKKKLDDTMGVDINMDAASIIIYNPSVIIY